MATKSKTAKTVTKLREAMKLSKAALARNAGLEVITIKRLEAGKVNPRLETLQALAKALNVPMVELLP